MTTISLVRHGLVENPNQVYYGRLAGFGLAQLGRAQAAAAGRLLAAESVAAIYHSPMQRAAETAALLHAQMPAPVPLVESPLLNEIHSPYDGLTVAEMERRNWDFYSQLSTPYEFPNDVLGRVVAFFDMARRRHAGQHVVEMCIRDSVGLHVEDAANVAIGVVGHEDSADGAGAFQLQGHIDGVADSRELALSLIHI